jgi:hypothetical protein
VHLNGIEVVHPVLATLFGIPIKSFIGSVVEFARDGVPLILVVLEPRWQLGYSMICSRRAASSGAHLGDLRVCLRREMLWYSKKA